MKLAVIDFQTLLGILNGENVHTKTFEIYYDICRLLDIEITKEACFKLYTKHNDNYGKLKDYLCAMKKGVDKKKFDEEFVRRYKQLFIDVKEIDFNERKLIIQEKISSISNNHTIVLIGIGNLDFMKIIIANLEIAKYINSAKLSEYLMDYPKFVQEVYNEYAISGIEDFLFVVGRYQDDIVSYFSSVEPFNTINKRFQMGL